MHESAAIPQLQPDQRELLSLPIQVHLVDNAKYPCSWSIERAQDFIHQVNEVFAPAAIHFQATVRRCAVPTVSLEAAFDYPELDAPKGPRKVTSLPLMATENYEHQTINLFLLDTCRELGTNLRVPGIFFTNVALFSVYQREKFLRSHCIRLARMLEVPLDTKAPPQCLMNFESEGVELRESEIESLRAGLLGWLEKRKQLKPPPAGTLPEIVLPVQAHLVSNPTYPCSWGPARLQTFFHDINSVLAQARVRLDPHIQTTQVPSSLLEPAFQQNEERQPKGNCEALRALARPQQLNLFFLDFCPVLNSHRFSMGETYREHGIALVSLWEHKLRNQVIGLLGLLRVSYDKDAAEPNLMNYKNKGYQLRPYEIEPLRETARAWLPKDSECEAPPPAPPEPGPIAWMSSTGWWAARS